MSSGDSKSLWLEVHGEIPDARISLGRASSNAYRTDPKMIGFMAARYKFVAKMLEGVESAIEIGCGDGFGAPVVAQAVGKLLCTDIDEDTLADNARRLAFAQNLKFEYFDFRGGRYPVPMHAAYCVDVIEHVFPAEEPAFMRHLAGSLAPMGIAIVGTPNQTAEKYASENSRKGHINLKDHRSLRGLLQQHFERVFLFSMNDEVLHTGYYPMAHYLWGVCVGPKPAG
jgi:protein-L-isoaspartate O-methyltransferase